MVGIFESYLNNLRSHVQLIGYNIINEGIVRRSETYGFLICSGSEPERDISIYNFFASGYLLFFFSQQVGEIIKRNCTNNKFSLCIDAYFILFFFYVINVFLNRSLYLVLVVSTYCTCCMFIRSERDLFPKSGARVECSGRTCIGLAAILQLPYQRQVSWNEDDTVKPPDHPSRSRIGLYRTLHTYSR